MDESELKDWANHPDQRDSPIALAVRNLFKRLEEAVATSQMHVDRVSRILTLEERCARAEADSAAWAKEVQRLRELNQPKAPWEEGNV